MKSASSGKGHVKKVAIVDCLRRRRQCERLGRRELPSSDVLYEWRRCHTLAIGCVVCGDREPISGTRHPDVEQSSLVVHGPFVARAIEASFRKMPVLSLAGLARRKPLGRDAWHEYDRPLQTLRLVHGRQVDGVERKGLHLPFVAFELPERPVLNMDHEPAVVPFSAVLSAYHIAGLVGIVLS